MGAIIIGWVGLGAYLYLALIWVTYMLDLDRERRAARRAWKTIVFYWPIISVYGMFLFLAWAWEDIWSGLGEIIRSNQNDLGL